MISSAVKKQTRPNETSKRKYKMITKMTKQLPQALMKNIRINETISASKMTAREMGHVVDKSLIDS